MSSLSLTIAVAAIGIALASTAQSKVPAIDSFPMIDQQPQTRNITINCMLVDLGSTFEALGIKEDTRVQVRFKMAISASRSK